MTVAAMPQSPSLSSATQEMLKSLTKLELTVFVSTFRGISREERETALALLGRLRESALRQGTLAIEFARLEGLCESSSLFARNRAERAQRVHAQRQPLLDAITALRTALARMGEDASLN